MSPEAKQKIQLALLVAVVVASLRAGYILYQRHEDKVASERQQLESEKGYSNADYYVSPKKLHPYDLKSAKQLTEQPEWVKVGYHYTYYDYDSPNKKVDFDHSAGLLGPIEKLQIEDVITAMPKGAGQPRQVLALFEKDGKKYAVPIGYEEDQQYKFYSDDMFFVEDPHVLYKHWPTDVWQAVESHQVKPGMNELQTDFAIGLGIPDPGATTEDATVRYANGGKPMVVVFQNGKVIDVKADTTRS
jgi:hypothetical protein